MRFTILGGIGYLGSRLSAHLLAHGHSVCVTTRRPLSEIPPWSKASEYIQTDYLRGNNGLVKAIRNRDVIIYLAGPDEIWAGENPQQSIDVTTSAIRSVLKTMPNNAKNTHFIYVSSYHVYGVNLVGKVNEKTIPDPKHPYGVSRLECEKIVQEFGRNKKIHCLTVRLSNAFGCPPTMNSSRWKLVFNDLCQKAASHEPLVLFTNQQRNYITMEDTVRALEFLSLHPKKWPEDGVVHVGSAYNWTSLQVAERISAVSQKYFKYEPVIVKPADEKKNSKKLNFDVKRLAKAGFKWKNAVDKEIKLTIQFCLKAR